MPETLQPQIEKRTGDTAGGRIRCLLCGKATTVVAGMITESEIPKIMGTEVLLDNLLKQLSNEITSPCRDEDNIGESGRHLSSALLPSYPFC
jgi:hypothetical protein